MNYVALSVVAMISLSSLAQPVVFAAYGGGWGGSSISSSSSSTSALKRDVCPDGDKSPTYYDGSCASTRTTPSSEPTFVTQSVSTTDVVAPTEQVEEWIVERKKQLQEAIDKNSQQVMDMPMRYRSIQRKVETIMSKWEDMDTELRHKKSVLLIKKISKLIESKNLPPKLLITVKYIQDKAVLMTTYN
jgi:hypothetical protein